MSAMTDERSPGLAQSAERQAAMVSATTQVVGYTTYRLSHG